MTVLVRSRRPTPAQVAVVVMSTYLIPSASARELGDSGGWRVYQDQAIGVSIRLPPSMTIVPGEEPRVGFHWPKPDLQFVLNETDLDKAGITRALVVVYASSEGYCPPDFATWDPQTLDGRDVYHHTWWDAAGAFGFHTDGFSTLYRGKCLLVEMIVETSRGADETPKGLKERDAHFGKVTRLLTRVMRTTRFLDRLSKR